MPDGQTLTNLSGLLKRWYTREFIDLTNRDAPLATIVKNMGRQDVGGQDLTVFNPFLTSDIQSIRTTGEGGTFPNAQAMTSSQGSLALTYLLATIGFNGQALAAAESGNLGSFVDLQMESMDRARQALHIEMEIESLTKTDGLRARINAPGGSTSTTVTVDNGVDGPGNRWLSKEMLLTAFTSTARTTQDDDFDGVEVNQVPTSNRAQFTIDSVNPGGNGDGTYDDGGFITRDDDTSSITHAVGMMDWLGDTNESWDWFNWSSDTPTATVWGIARSTLDELNAHVVGDNNHVARELTEERIDEAMDRILESQGFADGSNYIIISTPGVQRAMVTRLRAERRFFQQENRELVGGIAGMSYDTINAGNVNWVVDRFWMPNSMAILDLNTWRLHEAGQSGFIERAGGLLVPQLDSNGNYTDAMEAHWKHYWNLACYKPRKNVAIVDLSEQTG